MHASPKACTRGNEVLWELKVASVRKIGILPVSAGGLQACRACRTTESTGLKPVGQDSLEGYLPYENAAGSAARTSQSRNRREGNTEDGLRSHHRYLKDVGWEGSRTRTRGSIPRSTRRTRQFRQQPLHRQIRFRAHLPLPRPERRRSRQRRRVPRRTKKLSARSR